MPCLRIYNPEPGLSFFCNGFEVHLASGDSMKNHIFSILFGNLVLVLSFSITADVRLPNIIGDHMVLQQESTVTIWGWANPAEKVQVTPSWNATVSETVAGNGGKWSVGITTPIAGGPYTMKVAGANTIDLKDILIGQVWVCSGQSNMEWSGNHGLQQCKDEAPNANDPNIRFFYIPKTTALFPQDRGEGAWKVCSPEEMMQFSAVGYFFGKQLRQKLGSPVGLINSNWGGTPAEVWTPGELVENDPELQVAASQIQPFAWWPNGAGLCYNAMIHPITSYKIAGAIWYQGESNVSTAYAYEKLFTTMIGGWRSAWNSEFPFYFVQIAPYEYGNPNTCALLREAQTRSAFYPDTGMVVVSDLVDDIKNIHPNNKRDVGLRLANYALSKTYGHKNIPHRSPQYRRMETEGQKIRVFFDHAESGLMARGGDPDEFYIAGSNGEFLPAKAEIDGSTVLVSSESVANPVAVRFGFSNTAMPNLFSKEGLPVNLFRTDQFKVQTSKDPQ